MEFEGIVAQFQTLWPVLVNNAISLLQPWRMIQIGVLIVCYAFGWLLARRIAPRMDAWMREQSMPTARARFLILIRDRLGGIFFCAFAWIVVAVLRQSTWPSRSYLIALIASLITGWLIISISSRLIRNRPVRKVVRWSALAFLTLYLFGVVPEATAVLDGLAITFGEVRISVLLVLKTVFTLGVLIAVASWLSAEGGRRIERAEDLSPSLKVLSEKALTLFLFGAAVVLGLRSAGFDLTTLTVLSGAIGLGLGFGLQKVVSNLVSGLILLLDKSIKPGDVISLGETFGWISALGARYVSVVTRDGREYLIPNEDLITGQVVNWSHSNDLVRLDIYFGVSYSSDPHVVRKTAREAAETVDRVISPPAPVCHIVGFGDSSIDFILRFWIRDPTGGLTNVRGNVYLALWDALKAADIEIPFPRRDVTILRQEDAAPERALGEPPG